MSEPRGVQELAETFTILSSHRPVKEKITVVRGNCNAAVAITGRVFWLGKDCGLAVSAEIWIAVNS